MLIDAADGIDGALLHLHGAMVDRKLRGRRRRIAAPPARQGRARRCPSSSRSTCTATSRETMAKNANALIAVRTYPHIDYYERAWQGAELLQRALRRRNQSAHRHRAPPDAARPRWRTHAGRPDARTDRPRRGAGSRRQRAGRQRLRRLHRGRHSRHRPERHGHHRRRRSRRRRRIAEEFMDYAWQTREFTPIRHRSIEDAVRYAQEPARATHDKPLIMADVTDNPGSGHYGDATNLLRAMIAADLQNAAFYAIYRPAGGAGRGQDRRRQHGPNHARRQARRGCRRRAAGAGRAASSRSPTENSRLRPDGRRRLARAMASRAVPRRRRSPSSPSPTTPRRPTLAQLTSLGVRSDPQVRRSR